MEFYKLNIDGLDYRVHVIWPTLKARVDIEEGQNSGIAQSGRHVRSIRGTRLSHTMQVEPDPRYPEDFDALFWALSAPVASHVVTLPFGQSTVTYEAEVSAAEATWQGKSAGYERWKGLTVSFKGIRLLRKAGEV